MFLKTIPLFTVIFIAFIALGTGDGIAPTMNPIVPIEEGSDIMKESNFSTIILALPPIMFAFDGFVYSASMQNEAKDQKTFMTA
jgi:amino acid transporter